MSQSDLKEAERRIYLSYFNDGIADIVAGLPIFLFGLGMVFDATMFFILSWMPIIFFWPLKQAITLPRIGYVEFSPERQRRISRSLVLLIIAGTISLLLGLFVSLGFEGELFNLRDFMMEYSLLIFGAVMASAYGLIALLFDVRRFYAYGAIVFGGWLSSYLFDIEPGVPVAVAGGVVAAVGLGMFINFLIKYPIQE
jgi:hypothetical protein